MAALDRGTFIEDLILPFMRNYFVLRLRRLGFVHEEVTFPSGEPSKFPQTAETNRCV